MKAISLPISTDRLCLRLFTPDDVDDMYAYRGLAEVAQYLYRPPRSRNHCAEVIAETAVPRWDTDGDSLTLAVRRRDEPGVVGEVKLTLASERARQMEVGWVLNPRHGKQGFATEAARALAAAAFDQLGAHRIYARGSMSATPAQCDCVSVSACAVRPTWWRTISPLMAGGAASTSTRPSPPICVAQLASELRKRGSDPATFGPQRSPRQSA